MRMGLARVCCVSSGIKGASRCKFRSWRKLLDPKEQKHWVIYSWLASAASYYPFNSIEAPNGLVTVDVKKNAVMFERRILWPVSYGVIIVPVIKSDHKRMGKRPLPYGYIQLLRQYLTRLNGKNC